MAYNYNRDWSVALNGGEVSDDKVLCGLLIGYFDMGIPKAQALNRALSLFETDNKGRKDRSIQRDRLERIYNDHILKNGLDNNTDGLSKDLEKMCFFSVD